MNDDLLEYGEKVNSQKLNIILEHIFLRNHKIKEELQYVFGGLMD